MIIIISHLIILCTSFLSSFSLLLSFLHGPQNLPLFSPIFHSSLSPFRFLIIFCLCILFSFFVPSSFYHLLSSFLKSSSRKFTVPHKTLPDFILVYFSSFSLPFNLFFRFHHSSVMFVVLTCTLILSLLLLSFSLAPCALFTQTHEPYYHSFALFILYYITLSMSLLCFLWCFNRASQLWKGSVLGDLEQQLHLSWQSTRNQQHICLFHSAVRTLYLYLFCIYSFSYRSSLTFRGNYKQPTLDLFLLLSSPYSFFHHLSKYLCGN